MPIEINPLPAGLDPSLVAKLEKVSFATLGHYLEAGFVDPAVVRQCGTARVVGRAITVRTTATDSTMLHHAAGYLEPGDVLVVDTGADRRHAPVGLVVAATAAARGARGIVVDGVVTDVDEVSELGIPVYAYGRSLLTTKLHGIDDGGHHVDVTIGGVTVRSGDVILADANGVFASPSTVLEQIIDTALKDDAEEPALIAAVRSGARLGAETGATEIIEKLTQ
ncbi:MAG: RraA family protein [Mycobacterium sp.]